MKKIIAFVVGTIAVLAIAIGYQATGASGGDGDKHAPSSATSTAGAKADDGERPGFTADHGGKPGENKP